jgi:hypothetical protein
MENEPQRVRQAAAEEHLHHADELLRLALLLLAPVLDVDLLPSGISDN